MEILLPHGADINKTDKKSNSDLYDLIDRQSDKLSYH